MPRARTHFFLQTQPTKGTAMRKNFARQMPAQPRHVAVRALARCFSVLKRAVVRRVEAVDARPLDQRVRESGEW
jgi:hypothetical protein